jgi:hypothetical protein
MSTSDSTFWQQLMNNAEDETLSCLLQRDVPNDVTALSNGKLITIRDLAVRVLRDRGNPFIIPKTLSVVETGDAFAHIMILPTGTPKIAHHVNMATVTMTMGVIIGMVMGQTMMVPLLHDVTLTSVTLWPTISL